MERGERGQSAGAVADGSPETLASPPANAGAWLQTIRAAADKLKGAIIHTPAVEAPKLSVLSGAQIFLKYECMQATGSFKERGALLKLLSLSETERKRGVIAISAGNHAQAVAYHAARLGIPATVVMPEGTPFNKVANTEGYGAKVILAGEHVGKSQSHADRLIAERGFTLVHPYDDAIVIAGQGTAGLEFIEDCPALDCLIVPIGGGGFISGVAAAVKALKPEAEIVGVEVEVLPLGLCGLARGASALRRADARGRHRGQGLRRAHAADDPRAGSGRGSGEREGHRGGNLLPGKPAEDHRRRSQRRRARRRSFQSRAICRPPGRAVSMRREYRSAGAGFHPDAGTGAGEQDRFAAHLA